MESEFNFVGSLSLQETYEMDQYRLKLIFRPMFRRLLNIIAAFFLIMAIYRLIVFKFSLFPLLIIIGALYGLFGWQMERRYRIKKEFKKYENDNRESIIRLNEETVYIKNKLMETSFDWKVIKRAIAGPKGILVQVVNYQNIFYLPSYHFGTDEKRDKLLELFRKKEIQIEIVS